MGPGNGSAGAGQYDLAWGRKGKRLSFLIS